MGHVKKLVNEIAAAKEAAAGGRDLLDAFGRAIAMEDDPRIRLGLALERMRIRRSGY